VAHQRQVVALENLQHVGQLPYIHRSPKKTGLFADHTSTATMWANQLRPWFDSLAHVMIEVRRHIGFVGADLTDATRESLLLKLLKIGALVKISVRRVLISMASSYPFQPKNLSC